MQVFRKIGCVLLVMLLAMPQLAPKAQAADSIFPTGVKTVGAGYLHSLLIAEDGTVWAWGDNSAGALGDGTTTSHYRPVQVTKRDGAPLSNAKAVYGGGYFSVALLENGTVWAWGKGNTGTLGNGSLENLSQAVQVMQSDGSPLTQVQSIAAGYSHVLALKTDGTVWGWGSNGSNMLSDSWDSMYSRAIQIKASSSTYLTGVKEVAVGDYHSMLLKQDGTVWAWGHNGLSQLGNGQSSNGSAYPVQVMDSSDQPLGAVRSIVGHRLGGLALRDDGTVWSWGYNENYNLGIGSGVTSSNKAIQVLQSGSIPLTSVVRISGGGRLSMAQKADGTVWWWGMQNRNLQMAGSLISDIADFSAGDNHGLVLKNDGTVWGAGWTAYGELGIPSNSPNRYLTQAIQVYPARSAISATPNRIDADGFSQATITVTLRNGVNNLLGSSEGMVQLSSTLGQLGAVTDHGDGTYTAELTAPMISGNAVITGTLNGYPLASSATVVLNALAPSAALSTLIASPAIVTADGSSESTLTVQLKDTNGNPITTGGRTVRFSTTNGTLSSVRDMGNGSYVSQLRSPTRTGEAIVTATVDGVSLQQQARLQFVPGAFSAAVSTLNTSATTLTADGGSESTITLQLKDANGNSITTGGRSVRISTTSGTVGIVRDLGNGTYTAQLRSPTQSSTAVVTATVDNTAIQQTATIHFVPGPASAETSELIVPLTSMVAGEGSQQVHVQLKDAHGNELTSAGDVVRLEYGLGTFTQVTALGNGSYAASLNAGTIVGSGAIKATVNGSMLQSSPIVHIVPGETSRERSEFKAATGSIVANGSSQTTITLRTIDRYGNPRTTSAGTVSMSTTAGFLSNVTDLGNGQYTATLRSANKTGIAVVSARLSDTTFQQTVEVAFVAGAAAASRSMLTAAEDRLVAGSGSTELTVQLLDLHGNPLSSGGDQVVFQTTSGTIDHVQDHGNGQYSAMFTAPEAIGISSIEAMVNGSKLQERLSIRIVPGMVSTDRSAIESLHPVIVANGLSQSLITVRLKDAYGNALDAGGDQVVFNTTAGILGNTVDNGDGSYSVLLWSSTLTGRAVVSARVNGTNLIASTAVEFIPGPASATTSELRIDHMALTANGMDTTTVTVQLKDAFGNTITAGGDDVTIRSSTGILGPITDHGDGTYTAELTAGTISGTAALLASVNGESVLQQGEVQLLPGPAVANTSTFAVSQTSATADGSDAITVTVQTRDQYGNDLIEEVSYLSLQLSSTRGTIGELKYAGQGRYTADLRSSETGEAVISATMNGMELMNAPITVDFVAGKPSATASTLEIEQGTLIANGRETARITLQLKDATGHMIADEMDVSLLRLESSLGILSPLVYVGEGRYTAELRSTKSGTAHLRAFMDSIELMASAQIDWLPGPPLASASEVSVSQMALPANGTATARVTVQLMDAYGNPTANAEGVSIEASLGTVTEVTYGEAGEAMTGLYKFDIRSTEPGTADVRVLMNGEQIFAPVQVTFTKGMWFNPSSYRIQVGEAAQTVVEVTYGQDNFIHDQTDATQFRYDDSMVRIGQGLDGRWYMTGLRTGQTVIEAVYEGDRGTLRASAPVTVYALPVRLQLDATRHQVKEGEYGQLHVTVHYSDGTEEDVTSRALYHLKDESFAAVDVQGRVLGIQPGMTELIVSYEGLEATADVIVLTRQANEPPSSGGGDDISGGSDDGSSDGSDGGSAPGKGSGSANVDMNPGPLPPTVIQGQSIGLQLLQDGQLHQQVTLTAEQIASGKITVRMMDSASVWGVLMEKNTLARLLEQNPALVLEWHTPVGVLEVPVVELSEAARATTVDSIRLTLQLADEEAHVLLKGAANGIGAVIREHPFSVSLIGQQGKGDEQLLALRAQSILFSASTWADMTDPYWTAAVYDPHVGYFRYVPAKLVLPGTIQLRLATGKHYTLLENHQSFTDMKGHWAERAVELLASKLIVQGRGTGRFEPEQPVTRAELVAMLDRMLHPADDQDDVSFPNEGEDWYEAVMRKASLAGWVRGYEDGSLRPQTAVSRQEMMVMIARAIPSAEQGEREESTEQGFYAKQGKAMQGKGLNVQDYADIAGWAQADIARLSMQGLLIGDQESRLYPQRNATRAETASILARIMQQQ
ncbi:invasin domain 3-containing protein [Paenibacillus massiliensis]|uniref:invasin domain 3-containing protein n=1 Tax=Paenibacillus massiliensis TaxID=225917 RepID=UPI0003685633|nr:invasin domain 3-containing protein [Paenibacillus massiliensis]